MCACVYARVCACCWIQESSEQGEERESGYSTTIGKRRNTAGSVSRSRIKDFVHLQSFLRKKEEGAI